MFGYILPDKPELKIKEYEIFRAYYCGVCKSIGKRYGQLPRITLNYDSTFLAVLLSSITDETLSIKKERCIAHPVSKRSVIRNNDLIDYASDMNIILAYYNLIDDWKDEKSLLGASGSIVLKPAFKKLKRKYGEKCGIIEKYLQELAALEKEKCNSMDRAAEPFARLMEEITAFDGACTEPGAEKVLRWIGYNIGKWIYLIDAYDDIGKDVKNRIYNPMVFQFGYDPNEELNEFKRRIREKVEFNLTFCLSQIARAYSLLEMKCNSGLMENIIFLGMLRKTEQILGVGSCCKVEKSV